MKRRKLKPTKGYEIYLLELFCSTANKKYESTELYIIYWDKKTRRMFEETGLNITPIMRMRNIPVEEGVEYYEAWASKKPYRSFRSYERKIDDDFNRMGSLFESYDLNLTKVGEL